METSQIPRQRGLTRPALRARDGFGHRLLIALVVVTLIGVLALAGVLVVLLQRGGTQDQRIAEQGSAIRSLTASATDLSDQIRSLGAVPVVTPAEISGPAGQAGQMGATGATGPAGAGGADSTVPGPVGPTGPAGPAGPAGQDGAAGADGAPGQPGADGATGEAGRGVAMSGPIRDDQGTCVFRTVYSDGTSSDAPTRDENCPKPNPAPATLRLFFPT